MSDNSSPPPAPSPATTPACPECTKPLQRVRYEGGYLNRDQWESVRAGDWFCEDCKGTRSKSGYRYFWDREVIGPASDAPEASAPMPTPETDVALVVELLDSYSAFWLDSPSELERVEQAKATVAALTAELELLRKDQSL